MLRSAADSANGRFDHVIKITGLSSVCFHRRVRVFRFASGKLRRSYDESPEAAAELQRHGGDALKLEPIDFGRRLAVERELVADPEVRPHLVSYS